MTQTKVLTTHYKLTLEALKEVKAGKTINHALVEKWANSLGTTHPKQAPKHR